MEQSHLLYWKAIVLNSKQRFLLNPITLLQVVYSRWRAVFISNFILPDVEKFGALISKTDGTVALRLGFGVIARSSKISKCITHCHNTNSLVLNISKCS